MRTLLCLIAIFVSAISADAQQRFRDGDVFRMTVGGAPVEYTQEFTLEYTIDDGAVSIPHIGRIRAAGLSPSALAGAIEKRLIDEKLFTNPSVVLNPVQTPKQIIVGGAVRSPGRHPWSPDMTLSQAIASAAGPSEWAQDKVKLIRGGKAQEFSRKLLKKDPATDPRVLPNDYVEVQGDF